MRISPDEALKNLHQLVKADWKKLTEADTRAKTIDTLFIKCLNWEESDISREEHVETGYVDYTFRISGKSFCC